MADLPMGFEIKTKTFKTVKVLNKLGEGGQGAVYKVDYDGQPKALKWYLPGISNPDKFYANLENNIKKGAPTKAFLWPEDLTERQNGSFGYIMNLRTGEYEEFTKFLLGKVGFAGVSRRSSYIHRGSSGKTIHNSPKTIFSNRSYYV